MDTSSPTIDSLRKVPSAEDSTADCEGTSTPVTPLQYYIFGQGISFSMSPTIHNAGFAYYKLPHHYSIQQSSSTETFAPLIAAPDFGGASVTMPHKLAINKYCTSTSIHAQRIGAVNTLVIQTQPTARSESQVKQILGDNTDWSGLASIIEQHDASSPTPARTGLVIGAGGASRAAVYAMYQSGLSTIYLYNRTLSRASEIASAFSSLFTITILDSLSSLPSASPPDIIIGTVPADRTTAAFFPTALFAKTKGLCIDMAYKPRETPLLSVAKRHEGWETVTGVEVLLAQGYEQFQLWTGREAPKQCILDAVAAHDAATVAAARL